VQDVLDLLDLGRVRLEIVKQRPAASRCVTSFVESAESYETVYYPTKVTYPVRELTKTIAYSFDAQWRRNQKIPLDLDSLLDDLSGRLPDYRLHRVGLPMSLSDIVQTLASSRLLLSVDNGIAHVARSVGVPLALIEHLLPVERGFPRRSCVYTKVTRDNAVEKVVGQLNPSYSPTAF
jgi:hypothetical protein